MLKKRNIWQKIKILLLYNPCFFHHKSDKLPAQNCFSVCSQQFRSSLSMLSFLWNCQSHFYIRSAGRHLNASRYRLTVGGKTWRMTCWLKLSTSCLTESHSIWTFSLESCARIRVEQRFVTANKFFNQNTSINKFFYLKMCSSQTWLIFMTSIKGSEKNLEKSLSD